MIQTAYAHFAGTILSTRPLVRRGAIGLLLAAGAVTITLLIGVAGPLIALVLALAVVGATLILMDTHWGYVALVGVVFVLPFASLPFRLGFKPTFLDAALGALAFVWALKLVAGRPAFTLSPSARNPQATQARQFQISPIGLLIGLFMLMAIFSFVYGMAHSRPTTTIIRRFGEILLGIGLFFVVINTVRSQRELNWVVRWLFLAAWACASIAVLFYVIPEAWTVRVLNQLARFDYPSGFGALRWIEDDPDGTMRAIGTAVDPNVLGGMMILAAAMVGPQLLSPRPLFPRWLTVVDLRHGRACPLLDIQPFRPLWHGGGAFCTGSAQVPPFAARSELCWVCYFFSCRKPRTMLPACWKGSPARTWPHRCALASTRTL